MVYTGYDSGTRLDAHAVVADGGSFVIRYLSRGSWTQVSADEIAEYVGAGLKVGLVFETTETRALGGYAAGKSDAEYVLASLVSLGLPRNMEVFFSVDSDVDPVSVDPYFQGVHDTYADGGVYGSYRVVMQIENEFGVAGWQTAAWSNGARDAAAMLFQSGGQTQIGGVTVDIDYAQSLGNWAYGGNDMTPDDLLNYPLTRQGTDFNGQPLQGTTTLRDILQWTDRGWQMSAILLDQILTANQAELLDKFNQILQQLMTLTQPPATTITLSAQDRADIVQQLLRAQGEALGSVQVAPAPSAPPATGTAA